MKHFTKVSDYHDLAQLPGPDHPLISLVDYSQVNYPDDIAELKWKQDYYTIGLKRNVPYKLFYGQQDYDFDKGLMTFVAPGQLMQLGANPNLGSKEPTGYLLLIHPDFLWNTPLASKIKQYEFFGYGVNESLFLSEKEEGTMLDLLHQIQREYHANTDSFSQNIIIAQLELLLSYAERFYQRQFLTRKISNHEILGRLESLLESKFQQDYLYEHGVPSVVSLAEELHLSPNYLSSMLVSLTGQSTQQHIHDKLIIRAKSQLSSTSESISEIAYLLGFEHPSSFSKLFKKKTSMTPKQFRDSYH